MAKQLIVSATLFEIRAFLETYCTAPEREALTPILQQPHYTGLFNICERLDGCITGVGAPSCLYHLSRLPLKNYELVLGVGFVGSYCTALSVGEVVQITEDAFADLGIINQERFLPLCDTNFPIAVNADQPFYIASNFFVEDYRRCRAFTFNTPTGDLANPVGLKWQDWNVEVESMEGAAFAMVCQKLTTDYLSLRVVSNYVSPRHAAQWNPPLAQQHLAIAMVEVLKRHLQ